MNNEKELDKNISNILIVDDVPANLKVLGDILRNKGYKVRLVPNGKLALIVAENEKPDLILLDIMMPEMNGYEVCHFLKQNENLKDVPVIFISALNETDDIVQALNIGGVDYISKPFKAEEVIARVATHLTIFKQKQELVQLNNLKNKFFSIIAHDLKSPFNGILGVIQMLNSNFSDFDESEIKEMLYLLQSSSQNVYNLLEGLLDWSQTQTGRMEYESVEVDIHKKTNEIFELLKPNADKKELSLSNTIEREVISFVDERAVATVLRNLVSNAIKFTKNGGSINVSADVKENEIEISVSDSGIGMSEEVKNNLFKLDVHHTTIGTNHEIGTGIGLILCKELIEHHNGNIWAESELGKGSKFIFTLPKNEAK